MKTIKLIVIFFILSCYSSVFAGEEIRIATEEWSPFEGKKYSHYGIILHIISEVFNESGVKVKYGFFPWARSEQFVKEGEWHAAAICGKTQERKKYFYFSDDAVYTGELVLFYHKDHPIVWTENIEDLKGLRIGLPGGSALTTPLKEAEEKGLVTYDIVGDLKMNFLKLLRKRFHAVDANKAVALNIMQTQLSPEQRAKIGYTKPYALWNYHLIFSRKLKENEKFLEIFNKGLHKMKKSGKYDEMWKAFYRGEYNP